MERFYHSLEAVDNSYDDLNLPLFQDSLNKNSKSSASSKLIENVFHAHVEIDKKYVRQTCSDEKDSMPYLSGFFTGIYCIRLISMWCRSLLSFMSKRPDFNFFLVFK